MRLNEVSPSGNAHGQRDARAATRRHAIAAAVAAVAAVAPAVQAGTTNTYTGLSATNPAAFDDGTNFSLGTVPSVANDAVIDASNTAITAASTLTFNSSTSTTQAFGSLNVTSPYAITLQNAVSNASGGTPTVTLTLGGGSTTNGYAPDPGDLLYVASGSSLTLNNSTSSAATYGSLNLTLAQSGNFDVVGTAAINSAIGGAVGLTKSGTGTLTLTGVGTYTGGTTISQGTLALTGATNAAGTGSITIGAGTLSLHTPSSTTFPTPIVLTNTSSTVAATGTYTENLTGGVTGSGTLNTSGTGYVELSTSNSYTGGTVITQGTLYLYTTVANLTPVGTGNISIGAATLELRLYNVSAESGFGVVLTDPSSAIYEYPGYANTLTNVVSGSGNLNKTGTGTLTLSATNTYTGATNVAAGVLSFTTTNAIPSTTHITLAPGTQLLYSNATNNVALSWPLALAGTGFANVNVSSASVTDSWTGIITGTGGLQKVGGYALNLTNAGNTYAGGTNVSAGILRSNNTLATGTGPIAVLSGGTLGGSGSVGLVTVNSGGSIGAGASATGIGTLTSAVQTWSGGTILTKIDGSAAVATTTSAGDSTTPGTGSDLLVMSGLSSASTGMIVSPSAPTNGLTVGTTYSIVVAQIPAADVSSSPETFAAILGGLSISNSFYYANASFSDATSTGGDDQLVLTFTAAPEPTSLLLAGVAVAPLLTRRRAKRSARAWEQR